MRMVETATNAATTHHSRGCPRRHRPAAKMARKVTAITSTATHETMKLKRVCSASAVRVNRKFSGNFSPCESVSAMLTQGCSNAAGTM